MFTKLPKKVTKKYVYETDTETLLNLFSWEYLQRDARSFDDFENWYRGFYDLNNGNPAREKLIRSHLLHGSTVGTIFDKPNVIVRDFENSPGLWVFEFDNGIIIHMWSDGFRKNHYKGTSYEVVVNDALNDKNVTDAVSELFEFICREVERIEKENGTWPL